MTVFSLSGAKVQTDQLGQITGIEETMLDAVTRIGTNTLDVAYLGDPEHPFAVSLSDYNLLFDNVHINDADLPDQVEFFDLTASDGFNVKVLNFVFSKNHEIEERMFSVGDASLPQFRSPLEASLFFAQHEQTKVTASDAFTIHLDKANNVETAGVFVNLDALNSEFTLDDGFNFKDLNSNSDVEVWDVEFANAAQLSDAYASTLGRPPDNADPVGDDIWDEFALDQPTDPHIQETDQG